MKGEPCHVSDKSYSVWLKQMRLVWLLIKIQFSDRKKMREYLLRITLSNKIEHLLTMDGCGIPILYTIIGIQTKDTPGLIGRPIKSKSDQF